MEADTIDLFFFLSTLMSSSLFPSMKNVRQWRKLYVLVQGFVFICKEPIYIEVLFLRWNCLPNTLSTH